MIYFVSTLKVQLLLWTLVYASANSNSRRGHLPDMQAISNLIEQFLKPYKQSIKNNNDFSFRAKEESAVEKAIRKKIARLKPYLQDEERIERKSINETDDNLALEGNDETTIIEFVPKPNMKYEIRKSKDKSFRRDFGPEKENDTFRQNIKKYKQLRETIKHLLDKEKAGAKTKKVIIRTLDDMLSQLIESQCIWKNVDSPNLLTHLFRSQNNTRRSIKKLKKLSNQEWKNLRKQYLSFLQSRQDEEEGFMKQFHDLFTSVVNGTWDLGSKYKIRCQLIKMDDEYSENENILRYDEPVKRDKMDGKDKCDGFKVCSDELKDFLANFYKYVNDTAVSIFRNYAAMYVRDVNVDSDLVKNSVLSILENLSNTVEKKVNKLFKKDLEMFTLDENKKKKANIKHISHFITAVINDAKTALKKNLDREGGVIDTKLFTNVKDDLHVNLRLDMDNLGTLFIDRICSAFLLCNGEFASRRHHSPFSSGTKDTDNIYVKVQLTLDDELKHLISRRGSIARNWEGIDMTRRFFKQGLENSKGSNQNASKYNILNITRTTISTFKRTLADNTTQTTLENNEVTDDRNTKIK